MKQKKKHHKTNTKEFHYLKLRLGSHLVENVGKIFTRRWQQREAMPHEYSMSTHVVFFVDVLCEITAQAIFSELDFVATNPRFGCSLRRCEIHTNSPEAFQILERCVAVESAKNLLELSLQSNIWQKRRHYFTVASTCAMRHAGDLQKTAQCMHLC